MSSRIHHPVTAARRLAELRDDVQARGGSRIAGLNPFLRDVALYRAALPGRSRVQVRAAILLELVRLAPVEIRPGWILAGEHLISGQAASFAFRRREEHQDVERISELGVSADEIPTIRDLVRRWTARDDVSYYAIGSPQPENLLGYGNHSEHPPQMVFQSMGWIENHSIRDYQKVLRIGFNGIRREIVARMASADISDKDYAQQESFWRAALDVCEAGALLGQRHSAAAANMLPQANGLQERERLAGIAERARRVPADGARTFLEAAQSLWLAHILTCGEDGINANSLGRLDQILYPWYCADLEDGRITRREAVAIMAELACKLYLDYDVQAITLGGVDATGADAVNDLSYVILAATEEADIIRDLSIRVHRNTPPAFLRRASELIVRGGGIPYVFNDDSFIPALAERGIALEDARDYAPIGCIELTIPGRANPHAVSGWFNAAKCLELALFDGRDPKSGDQLGPRSGSLVDHATFEDLYEAYRQQVSCFARRMVYLCNRGELAQRERGPLPCWSVLTDDCIARGRDITDGGAVYNYHAICFMGMANVADSLAAVRKLVFQERRLSPEALLAALRDDYRGHEPVRQLLLRQAPKYGNDQPHVDDLARRVAQEFVDLMDGMESALGGRYYVHLFTFRLNIDFGKATGALPDGRRAGEPLAYSLSAHQGRDVTGVTAMLRSLARLPHDQAAGATAAIIDLDPAVVQGDRGADVMAQLIRGALDMGVGQLQWNVTTAERLILAQQDPERYGNVAVRVAGYSQRFKLIDKDLQDHIIARTKHTR